MNEPEGAPELSTCAHCAAHHGPNEALCWLCGKPTKHYQQVFGRQPEPKELKPIPKSYLLQPIQDLPAVNTDAALERRSMGDEGLAGVLLVLVLSMILIGMYGSSGAVISLMYPLMVVAIFVLGVLLARRGGGTQPAGPVGATLKVLGSVLAIMLVIVLALCGAVALTCVGMIFYGSMR